MFKGLAKNVAKVDTHFSQIQKRSFLEKQGYRYEKQ